MSKSPNVNGKVEPILSEDRTSSIGWYFITSYYDFYNTKIESIHKLYHQNASVSHASFPGTTDEDTVHKAQGTEAILARFKTDQPKKNSNRIVVTDAAFEVSMGKNILIVVFGEWSKEESPYYQFTQTFVLVPGKKENTFDVANDVLRFIGVERNPPKATETKKEPAATQEAVKTEKDQTKEQPKETQQEEEEPAKEEVKKVIKEEPKEETKEEQPEVNGTPAAEAPVEYEENQPTSESDSGVESKEEPADETKSNQPLSWAALASQAAPKSAAKPVPSPGLTKAAPAKKPAAAPAANRSFKKEEWFPIYIRGVKQVDEKVLRDHISKKFGELKFFKTNLNIALCDFVAVEAQKKALNAKETVIDGNTIYLEPRESKTGNNYHNGKKFKDQKDKPAGVDPKRKTEKKVVPKKPTKTAGRPL